MGKLGRFAISKLFQFVMMQLFKLVFKAIFIKHFINLQFRVKNDVVFLDAVKTARCFVFVRNMLLSLCLYRKRLRFEYYWDW